MGELGEQIEKIVIDHAAELIRRGAFDDAITDVIVDAVRKGPDNGLTRTGFILKMAVEMIDYSTPPLSFQQAKARAVQAYHEHKRDCRIFFGEPGWDWSGVGARIVAHEYEIDLWERAP